MIGRHDLARAVGIAARAISPDDEAACADRLRLAAVPAVLRLCPGVADPAKIAALVMWCDRMGAYRLERSGLRMAARGRNWAGAALEVRRIGGASLARIEAEARLLHEGD